MRVSVTDVDAYRYWRSHDLPLDNLRDRLLRKAPVTANLIVGRLLHSALERGGEGHLEQIHGDDGTVLRFELSAELELPAMREIPLSREYRVAGRTVELRGRVDGWDAYTVDDHKATSRFDPEPLVESLQWRFYLDMTGARRFRWNVFTVQEPRPARVPRGTSELAEWAAADEPTPWRVTALDRLEQWRYPGMERDCVSALEEFVVMVDRYVPEYGQERRAA